MFNFGQAPAPPHTLPLAHRVLQTALQRVHASFSHEQASQQGPLTMLRPQLVNARAVEAERPIVETTLDRVRIDGCVRVAEVCVAALQ